MSTGTLSIVNGPSKMDIMNAFAYGFDQDHDFSITFKLEDGEKIRVKIGALAHEDGSGNRFNIGCYVVMRSGSPEMKEWAYAVLQPEERKRYDMFYDVARRIGHINLEPASYLPKVEKNTATS